MKLLPALLVCSVFISGPAPALEFKQPNMIVLSPQEVQECDDGCSLIPNSILEEYIKQVMLNAYKSGQASCKNFT